MSGLTPQDVELESLRAENERLRVEARSWAQDHAQPLADAVERLQDEVQEAERERDALREELKQTGGIQAMARLNKNLTDQRDALADALDLQRRRLSDSARLVEYEMGAKGMKRWSRVEPIAVIAELYGRMGPMCQEIDAALRLVGRPQSPTEERTQE